MLETNKYARKPFHVDAVQVTADNIEEVASWCEGDIVGDAETETRYVKVKVYRPITERQTKAFVGDWVLYAGTGFKVYTPKAFEKSFALMQEKDNDEDKLLKDMFEKPTDDVVLPSESEDKS